MKKKVIPDEVRKTVEERLKQYVKEKYAKYNIELILNFKGFYLYVDYYKNDKDNINDLVEFDQLAPEKKELLLKIISKEQRHRSSHLCRMRYCGDIDSWGTEIYKYSDDCYDQESEYPISSAGTIEECFDNAATLYITETFTG